MSAIGIRELKGQLSAHLRRVQAGARLTVTDRGRAIALIAPVQPSADVTWAKRLAAEGGAAWSGGKPRGLARRAPTRASVSDAVVEDRR